MQTVPIGMTASTCPVTNARSPNVSRNFDGFHISYCNRSSDYGCPTTAIVLGGRVFFILNGNHAEPLCNAASDEGIQGCVDYFVENIGQANGYSEHLMATGVAGDPFDLFGTTLEIMGQDNINRIRQAISP